MKIIELFAGAGGLAIGLERAGFQSVLLNDFDKNACQTLRTNRPNWSVLEGNVADLSFLEFKDKIDVISGGFPCQAFSYAGKRMGFSDVRGTLFFEYARAVKEVNPKIILAENVKGLLNHDKGKTLKTILSVLDEIGYKVLFCDVLKAVDYFVPQKRERLIIVGVRKDLADGVFFGKPQPNKKKLTLKDALKKGVLYNCDVPHSNIIKYPKRKEEIMKMVPPGGYWKNLPIEIQKEYMKESFYSGGGKTGIAKRLSWDEPSLTLTCSPSQKQTERCHPDETRPLTVREYARIQTFPDDWVFCGSINSQYKQIGNAVPVNLGYSIGCSLIELLKTVNKKPQNG